MKKWRVNLVLIFVFLFLTTIIGRLFYLQVVKGNYWRAWAYGQQKIFQEIRPKRGEIYFTDKFGNLYPVVFDKNWKFAYLVPAEIEDKTEALRTLPKILSLPEEELLKKLEEKDNYYQIVKEKLSDEEIVELEKLKIEGLHFGENFIRFYPYNEFASNILGFVDKEGKGNYGIEGYYDESLRGEKGFLDTERDVKGQPIFFNLAKILAPTNGFDLILTIDYNIQFFAEKLLKKAQNEFGIEEGEIIVIEPKTGKLLAFGVFPNFNPNEYQKVKDFELFKNGAIQKLFEPGSVFKPITMAAALNEGRVTPETSYLDEGSVEIGGHIITNYNKKVWGESTMTKVLEKSINTGAVFAQQSLGSDLFLRYLEKLDIFRLTEIDLQGEVFSKNEEFKKGYEVNFATASFGQGIMMTPIQLAKAFTALINGGKLMKPYLVEKVVFHQDGELKTKKEFQPQILEDSVISQKTSSQLATMLVNVVENGFSKAGKISNYYIGGKTGTAQIPFPSLGINKKGYSEKTWQTFVGFLPAFDPKALILVKFTNPKTKDASQSALPIFKEIANYLINYWQLPTDY